MSTVKIVIHSSERHESSVSNPLGGGVAAHRIWTWPDGSWLLLRFLDDGCARAVTSRELNATVLERGRSLHVRVERRANTAGLECEDRRESMI